MHRLLLVFQKLKFTLTDNGKNLDIVMPIYNSLEYSKRYSKTTRSFWNYYRDERSSGAKKI